MQGRIATSSASLSIRRTTSSIIYFVPKLGIANESCYLASNADYAFKNISEMGGGIYLSNTFRVLVNGSSNLFVTFLIDGL